MLLVAAAAGFAPWAGAATTCTASGVSMGLGTYTGETATPADSIGTFTVRCSRDGGAPTVSVTVGIGASASSGSIANRKLRQAAGTDLLAYNLYRDVLRQNVWGETAGVNTVTQSVSIPNKASANVSFNVYGRIPGLQDVYPGSYSDTLVVTFSY